MASRRIIVEMGAPRDAGPCLACPSCGADRTSMPLTQLHDAGPILYRNARRPSARLFEMQCAGCSRLFLVQRHGAGVTVHGIPSLRSSLIAARRPLHG